MVDAGSIPQNANFSVHPTTQTFMISLTLKPGTVSIIIRVEKEHKAFFNGHDVTVYARTKG